jgi:cytochrome c oxidase assembly protein subunit 15
LQGVLGGLRVTLLKDKIGIFHACLAQAYFGMLIVTALATSPFWLRLSLGAAGSTTARRLASIAIVSSSVIYLQLALGATMRHEHRDLSILDFPTAYGKIIPDTSAEKITSINAWRETRALSEVNAFQIWLQMAHRFLAVAIGALVIAFWFSVRASGAQIAALSRLASWWLFLIASQIALGAWTIWSNKAADVATAHVAVGATTFGVGVALSAICLQLTQVRNLVGRSIERSFVSEGARVL